jgi:hypothetical protein
VDGTTFSGASLEYRVSVEGHQLRATEPARADSRAPGTGDEVWVSLPLPDIVTLTGEDADLQVGGPSR